MREFEFKLWKLKVEELEFKLREFELCCNLNTS